MPFTAAWGVIHRAPLGSTQGGLSDIVSLERAYLRAGAKAREEVRKDDNVKW